MCVHANLQSRSASALCNQMSLALIAASSTTHIITHIITLVALTTTIFLSASIQNVRLLNMLIPVSLFRLPIDQSTLFAVSPRLGHHNPSQRLLTPNLAMHICQHRSKGIPLSLPICPHQICKPLALPLSDNIVTFDRSYYETLLTLVRIFHLCAVILLPLFSLFILQFAICRSVES